MSGGDLDHDTSLTSRASRGIAQHMCVGHIFVHGCIHLHRAVSAVRRPVSVAVWLMRFFRRRVHRHVTAMFGVLSTMLGVGPTAVEMGSTLCGQGSTSAGVAPTTLRFGQRGVVFHHISVGFGNVGAGSIIA